MDKCRKALSDIRTMGTKDNEKPSPSLPPAEISLSSSTRRHHGKTPSIWSLRPGQLEVSGFGHHRGAIEWRLRFWTTDTSMAATLEPERTPEGLVQFCVKQEITHSVGSSWRVFYSLYYLHQSRTIAEIWAKIHATPGITKMAIAQGYEEKDLMHVKSFLT